MKFKALFLALLTIFVPATFAMDEPPRGNTEFTQKGIDSEDLCHVCHRLAKNVPQNARHITNCCNTFICEDDANNILLPAQTIKTENKQFKEHLRTNFPRISEEKRKKMYKEGKTQKNLSCPKCQKKLSISEAFLQKAVSSKLSLSLIDAEGKQFALSPELSGALLECESFKMHGDELSTPAPLDFANVKPEQKRFLKKNLIIQLAQFIKDPVKEIQHVATDLELFELANYLAAPNNILYLLANESWPLMQDKQNDNSLTKEYKKNIRKLAKPHLASPKHLTEYMQCSPHGKKLKFIKKWDEYDQAYAIHLSFGTISRYLENGGWYQDENNHWYKVYPFYTLDGIHNLWGSHDKLKSINLPGHRIETVSGALLEKIHPDPEQAIDINLDGNPIIAFDESFFQALAKKRAHTNGISLSFADHKLTDVQKEEVQKKFYQATTTLPQRYLSRLTYSCLAISAGCIGSALAVEYIAHKAPVLTNTTSTVSSGIIGLSIGGGIGAQIHSVIGLIGGIIVGAGSSLATIGYMKDHNAVTIPTHIFTVPLGGYAGLKLMNYAALKLARKSHPDISLQADNNIVWNSNYQLKI